MSEYAGRENEWEGCAVNPADFAELSAWLEIAHLRYSELPEHAEIHDPAWEPEFDSRFEPRFDPGSDRKTASDSERKNRSIPAAAPKSRKRTLR